MENIIEELRMKAKDSTIVLNNASKMGEISVVVEKTSQLFVTNRSFVENYISWWGKDEFSTVNLALDKFHDIALEA